MKFFWSWFIPFILIICVITYMLIIKVNSNIFKFDNILDEPKLITTLDNRNLYSIFDINIYNNKDLKDISYDELNTIANIIDFKDSLDDGGTKIFYSKKTANKKFYIIACHTLNGNNDIYILDKEDVRYCSND